MRILLGADLTQTGKRALGEVAYRTAKEYAPDMWWLDWDNLDSRAQGMFIAIACSVRGFHPDA